MRPWIRSTLLYAGVGLGTLVLLFIGYAVGVKDATNYWRADIELTQQRAAMGMLKCIGFLQDCRQERDACRKQQKDLGEHSL